MTRAHTTQGNAARGFTVIEILAYIFVLGLLLAVVVYILIAVSGSYHAITSSAGIESTAETALERMTRDTRDAISVDVLQSTLNASPGKLTLNTTDDDGATTTVQFFLSGQTIHVKEAGVDMGPLSETGVRITNLVFRQITTAQSQAVKIELTAESGSGKSYASGSFYSTVVLRGSYPVQ